MDTRNALPRVSRVYADRAAAYAVAERCHNLLEALLLTRPAILRAVAARTGKLGPRPEHGLWYMVVDLGRAQDACAELMATYPYSSAVRLAPLLDPTLMGGAMRMCVFVPNDRSGVLKELIGKAGVREMLRTDPTRDLWLMVLYAYNNDNDVVPFTWTPSDTRAAPTCAPHSSAPPSTACT